MERIKIENGKEIVIFTHDDIEWIEKIEDINDERQNWEFKKGLIAGVLLGVTLYILTYGIAILTGVV